MHSSTAIKIFSIVLLTAPFLACDPAGATQNSYSGYLVDIQSARQIRNERRRSKIFDFVTRYNKKTALSKSARNAGYCIYTSHYWLNLDQKGNRLAVKTLNRTIRKRGFFVLVHGRADHGVIATESLTSMVGTPITRRLNR